MMIVRKLHDAGLTSEHAYAAAFGSIGLSLVSWMTSLKAEQAGLERADRWGIFIGEWAPTFFALGIALARYEEHPRETRTSSDGIHRPVGSPEPFRTSP